MLDSEVFLMILKVKIHTMKKLILSTIALLFLSFASHAALVLPKESLLKTGFKVDYDVNYNGMGIGVSKRVLSINDNTAIFEATTLPEGLAAMFISETITERSEIEITSKKVHPTKYNYIKDKKGKIEKIQLKFDWDKKILSNDYSKIDTELKPNTHDLLSFQLQIIKDLQNKEDNMQYYVATKKHTRLYTLKYLKEEEVITALGNFSALKLETNTIKGNSKFTFWCAPVLGFLPIKIQKTNDKGDEFSFILRDFSVAK